MSTASRDPGGGVIVRQLTPSAAGRGRGGEWKPDWPVWVLSALLVLWAGVPLLTALVHVLLHGGTLSGTDAALAGADQQQYMAQIRGAGEHLLISDQFRLGSSPAVYLNPMLLLSGLIWRAGVDLRVTMWLWIPVGAGLMAIGVLSYVRRLLPPRERLPAVLLALLFFSPALPAFSWTHLGLSAHSRAALLLTSGEVMPAWQLWGYLHTVIVLALVPLCLLALERGLCAEKRPPHRSARWYLVLASAEGCLIAWLHPWQGLVLLTILVGVMAWGGFRRSLWVLALPALAAAAPMAYLYVLSRTSADWRLFAAQNRAFHDSGWVLLLTLAPLVIPALAGLQRRRLDVQERMLVLWPLACGAVYLLVDEFPFHVLQGICIPLGVLAVRGWGRLTLPRTIAICCLALVTLPGLIFQLDTFASNVRHKWAPYWLTSGEAAALRYLDQAPGRGGVLARYYLGMTVPAFTGRSVWVGHYVWSPDFARRLALAEHLFTGAMPAGQAQALVRSSGASFLLSDCESAGGDLGPELGELVSSAQRFGCATVYRIRPAPSLRSAP